MEAILGEYRRVLAAHPNMLPLAGRRSNGMAPSGLQFLVDQGFWPDDAVELYQSLVSFTVGYSMLGSPLAQVDWSPLPQELAERSREWRDATYHRTLRMIMEGYGSRRGSGADGGQAAQ